MTSERSPFVWIGPIYEPTGYADEGRGIVRALAVAKVPVALRPMRTERPGFRDALAPGDRRIFERQQARGIEPPVIVCQHLTADGFVQDATAAMNIGRTMFETDGLPAHWVPFCNDMDELWLPSTFNRDTFRAAGVTTPVTIVPGGIDSERYRPEVAPLGIDGARGTVFLSVFEWRHRKGWDVLLRAWAEAFGPDDNVSLVLRTYPQGARDVRDRRAVIDAAIDEFLRDVCGRTRADVAPIIPLTQMLTDAELPALYTRADAYVSPTRGEGWGRPFMEAMACGLPVIATRWSAHLDFMHDGNSLLLDIEGLVDANDPDMPIYRGQRWAEPSVRHLVELLQRVHLDRGGARAIGAQARAEMVADWSWGRAADVIGKRLAELGHRRHGTLHVSAATAGESIIVDAELFPEGRPQAGLEHRLVSFFRAEPRARLAVRGAVQRRPARHRDAYLLWERRVPDHRVSARGGVVLSMLRRGDSTQPVRPSEATWIVMTGDTVHATVPDEVQPLLRAADAVWVPHALAAGACLKAGVSPDVIWQMPLSATGSAPSAVTVSRPLVPGTVFTLAVAVDSDVTAADALIRTWERAFTGHQDRVLRVVLAAAATNAAVAWYAELLVRHSARASTTIELWPTPLAEDLWPAMMRATDVLLTPSSAPSIADLWSMAAQHGVPVIAASGADSDAWVPQSGGWTVPMAATGRFTWSAFAAAVDEACSDAVRAMRAARAREAYSLLPDASAMAEQVMIRLDGRRVQYTARSA